MGGIIGGEHRVTNTRTNERIKRNERSACCALSKEKKWKSLIFM